MAQSDDIAVLTEVLVRMHQRGGLAENIRQQRGLPASAIGKAAGCTPEMIYSWERGLSQPTTAQGLQWLRTLHQLAPDHVVGHARSAAAGARQNAAQRAVQAADEAVDW